MDIYKQLAKIRQNSAFTDKYVKFLNISDIDENPSKILSYIRTRPGSDKYLVVINFGHRYANNVDLSEGAGSSKGEVVVNAMSNYKVNTEIDLKHITLSRGQGLVIKVK